MQINKAHKNQHGKNKQTNSKGNMFKTHEQTKNKPMEKHKRNNLFNNISNNKECFFVQLGINDLPIYQQTHTVYCTRPSKTTYKHCR